MSTSASSASSSSMLDRKFILVFVFSIILETVVHESLINGQTNYDDLDMDQKSRVLKPDIMAIKKLLEDRGYVLIPGQIMKELLIQFGATEEDFRVLESGYIHRYLPLDQQPVMRHRLVNILSKESLSLTFLFRTRVTVFCTTQRTSHSSPRTPTPSPSIQAMR